MLAGDEQNISEALLCKGPGLAQDLIDAEGHAQNGIVPRKPAIFAIVDTLVGEVERGEKADDLAEALAGQ